MKALSPSFLPEQYAQDKIDLLAPSGTTFPEGQFWKCTKAMAMKWSTQTSLTKFRSVFGNGSDLDSLGFSVSLHSNPRRTWSSSWELMKLEQQISGLYMVKFLAKRVYKG